jgi:hypothetical protein
MITSDRHTERHTIDSSFGVPEEYAAASAPSELKPARRVRTPVWRRIGALGALGGITAGIGVALAVALIGVAVLTLMLLEQAIG